MNKKHVRCLSPEEMENNAKCHKITNQSTSIQISITVQIAKRQQKQNMVWMIGQ
jgi:hypothetical protein